MKKFISLILAVVMVMAMAISVSAAERACNHITVVKDCDEYYTFGDESTCYHHYDYFMRCSCGKYTEDYSSDDDVDEDPHDTYLKNASCNGNIQSLNYYCRNCKSLLFTSSQRCPGAGLSHSGGCRWLPV